MWQIDALAPSTYNFFHLMHLFSAMQGRVNYKKLMETKFEFKSILWQASKEGRKGPSSPWLLLLLGGFFLSLAIYIYYASPWIFVIYTLINISFLGSAIASFTQTQLFGWLCVLGSMVVVVASSNLVGDFWPPF
jgi:hypothetical protein